MNKVSDHILRRVYILFGVFVLLGAIIVFRILALQVNVGYWAEKEIEEQVFFKKVLADRGNILSEDGTIMATSLPFFKVAMDPTVLDTGSFERFSDSLYQLSLNFAGLYDDPEERDSLRVYRNVMKALAERDRHIYLHSEKINFRQLAELRNWPILKRGRYQGGLVVEKFTHERYYPMGELARITLGKIVEDTVPIRGIEYSYHNELRGKDGYILAQKVVGGSYIPVNQFGDDASQDGYDVVTTLDVDLQDIVEKAVEKAVRKHYAKYGVAILMEVETGKIKAIANYPENYNHAVATQVEPGSTFKTASAAALFEDKLLSPDSMVATGEGKILYDDKEVTDNGKAWGDISFEKVFAHSSNVGVSKTINDFYGAEPEKYIEHLQRFGFFDRANVQLKGEPLPRIITPEDEEWTVATLPSLSYGYSLLVTPIQMASFYNGIANRGRLLRPWMVKEILENSRIIRQYGPEVIHPQMISPESLTQLKRVMKAVTEYGTAASAFRNCEFEVAGKTGTARKTEAGRGYVRKYRASFGGFFPVDTPRYSMYIMIDEPDGGTASGGKVAAPVFREIAKEILRMDVQLTQPPRRKDMKPHAKPAPKAVFAQTARSVYKQLGVSTSLPPEGDWYKTQSNKHQVNLDLLEMEEGKVPDVRGMTTRDALVLLEKMGLLVVIKGNGRVKTQSLLPGHRPEEGTKITLYCS